MANVTYAQLTEATDVVDTDLLASFRGAGPLKRLLASTLRTYLANASGFLQLDGSNSPITGPVQFYAGNVGSPGISGSGDADTGLFFPSANALAVATGGVQRGVWDSTGYTASFPINYAAVADVASATTCNIGAASSNYVRITGTTTITAFDTVAAGVCRIVRFAGILTLTYNATTMILPGAATITTAAGDMAKFVSEGSGNWRCEWYSPAGALPVNRGGTGGATQATARSGLGLGTAATQNANTFGYGATVNRTISSNSIVYTAANHLITGGGTLNTITGAVAGEGKILFLRGGSGGTVTVNTSSGGSANTVFGTGAAFTLDNPADVLTMIFTDAGYWLPIAFQSNG